MIYKDDLSVAKFIFLFLLGCNCFGQFNVSFQPPKAPDAYLFEKYGQPGISKYTGKPEISIPLYNISYGDINLPLSITYTSNGIRVDEEASQVGLGWYFGTGMISQNIQGKDDLRTGAQVKIPDYYWQSYPQYVVAPYPGWLYENYPEGWDYDDPERILISPSIPGMDKYFIAKVRSDGPWSNLTQFPYNGVLSDYLPALEVNNNNVDIEIDIFTANFFGHSIKFYRNPKLNGAFCILDNSKYRVNIVTTVNSNLIEYEWQITAPDGICYYFKEENKTIYGLVPTVGYTETISDGGTGYMTSTNSSSGSGLSATINTYSRIWRITKIKDTKGNEILFNYDNLFSIYSAAGRNGKADFVNVLDYFTAADPFLGSTTTADGPYLEYHYPLGKHIAYHKGLNQDIKQEKSVLASIIYGDSKITFDNTSRIDIPNDKKISNISVTYQNNPINNIEFTYDYFTNNSTDNTQKRLRLKELKITERPYKFEYNSTPLPNKDSNSFDYWGYYNGMPNTTGLNNPFRLYEESANIPLWAKDLMPLVEGIANRSAHPVYCKAGILEKIIYPTGGFTKIEYELNEFNNQFFPNYDNKVGLNSSNNYVNNYTQTYSKGYGLRVVSTSDYVDLSTYYKTKYLYEGGKHITPYIAFNDTENYRSVSSENSFTGGAALTQKTVSAGNMITTYHSSRYQANVLSNGDHVGYDKVTEVIESNNAQNNGKTEFYYTNVPDVSAREKFGFGVPRSLFDYFGYSIRATDVDNGSLLTQRVYDKNDVLKQEINYSYYSEVPLATNGLHYNVKTVKLPYYNARVVGNTTADCSGCPPVTEVYNEYLFYYYPLKSTNTRLKRKTVTDFFPTGSKTLTNTYFYNNNYLPIGIEKKNEFGEVIEKEEISYFSSYETSYNHQINLPSSKITRAKGEIINQIMFSYQTLNNVIQLSLSKLLPQGINDSGYTKSIVYDLFDDKNNILQYHKENDLNVAIIWGYNKTLPIAKIDNLNYSDIQSWVPSLQLTSRYGTEEDLLTQLNSFRNSISSQFPSAMITTYSHKPLVGPSTVTDPRGNKTSYVYDSYNRLKEVRDNEGNILSSSEYNFKQ